MFRSLRSRVTLVASLVVLAVLGATAVALVAAQRTVLTEGVDELLHRQVAEVADTIAGGGTTGDGVPATIPAPGDEDGFAAVYDAAGERVAESVGAPDTEAVAAVAADAPTAQTLPSAGGPFRVMAQLDGDLRIVVGTPLDDVEDSVAVLIGGLAVALPIATLTLAVVVWLIVGRVLRPVERIRVGAAEITGGRLDRRVDEPGTGDEIDRLAQTMNSMLERLEDASTRQRRFVADASHELRSPLTRIRTALEVDRAHPATAVPERTEAFVLEQTQELQRLVGDLLLLARLDDAAAPPRRELVDLDEIVMHEVARSGADVDVSGVSGAQVLGDAGQLSRAMRNLLDNAVRHGGPPIRVTVREEGDRAEVAVSDRGEGIPPEARERVFERFGRVDHARSAEKGGTGLGLAIAREVVEANGGTLTLCDSPEGGTRFEIQLPVAIERP